MKFTLFLNCHPSKNTEMHPATNKTVPKPADNAQSSHIAFVITNR